MRYVHTRPCPKSTAAVAPFMSSGDCNTAEVEYALVGRTPLSQLKNRQSTYVQGRRARNGLLSSSYPLPLLLMSYVLLKQNRLVKHESYVHSTLLNLPLCRCSERERGEVEGGGREWRGRDGGEGRGEEGREKQAHNACSYANAVAPQNHQKMQASSQECACVPAPGVA